MAVQPRRKLTYQDFVRMPDDNLRREIIDGELFVTPAPVSRHQRIVGLLYFRIRQYLEQNPIGEIFVAPLDVVFSEFDVVEPDLIFVAGDHSGIVFEKNLKGVPTLLIEVMSRPATERRHKRHLYEKFEVPEYWIVDQTNSEIEVYVLKEGSFGPAAVFRPADTLGSQRLPGFSFEVSELAGLPA